MLVSLDKHCARLVEILTDRDIGCDNVAEWLQLAASIKKVEVDVIQYQKGFGFCRDADEYSIARENLLKTFVFELARFNFVWGGLEASINNVKPPKHPSKNKRGKIRNTCYFFETYFNSKPPIALLEEHVLTFRNAAKSCFGYHRIEERFKDIEEVGQLGVGLFSVYELRNLFSHGSLSFPEPDGENQPISAHNEMIFYATRIVLLSIQMLLLAYFEHSDKAVSSVWDSMNGNEEIPLWLGLERCHLVDRELAEQLSLL